MTSFTSFSLLESDKNNAITIKGERINSKIIPETYSNVKLSPNQNKIDVRVQFLVIPSSFNSLFFLEIRFFSMLFTI